MARRAEGWKLTLDRRSGIYGVRWTKDRQRHHESTGERDPGAAASVAARLYAEAVSGRRRQERRGGSAIEVDDIGAEWLADAEETLDQETLKKYKQYLASWSAFFSTVDRLTATGIEDFWRARLRVVKRRTVIKQLYTLNTFLRWCRARDVIAELPAYEMPPRSATGTPAPGRDPVETIPLNEDEVDQLLKALPELSAKARRGKVGVAGRWRARDRFIVAWETALRPATLDSLTAPADYRKGDATLKIRDEIDKARFGREVPLSDPARAALDRCAPDVGPILGPVGSHTASDYLRAAATKAKLPAWKAAKVKPYDLRHARLTLLAESGNLVGVAFIAGHKAITTTNRYVHSHARAAAEVLGLVAKGTGLGTGKKGRGGEKGGE